MKTGDANHARLARWLEQDAMRMRALRAAHTLALPQWCIAAGFVRNLVWDRLHQFAPPGTPLADVDLIYFDPADASRERDRALEARLSRLCPEHDWSVKNQVRMHLRNEDPPYASTCDAMRHWVEVETALGVCLDECGEIEVIHPFELDSLFDLHITPNAYRLKPDEFARRLSRKRWLDIWPKLTVQPHP